MSSIFFYLPVRISDGRMRALLPADRQKKELFHKRKSSKGEKRKHGTHRKNGCKLLFQFSVHF